MRWFRGCLGWAASFVLDLKRGEGGGEDAEEGCGWFGCCVFDGAFTKQPGEGLGTGRVGI